MSASLLFSPVALGALKLGHRVVMAPLTRMRSTQPGDIPNEMNALYYGQRASNGGLIITEATDISDQARGYPGVPGAYTPAQLEGWKRITDSVHAKGGLMVLQIWHTGRISHSSMQPGGGAPVAPSPVTPPGNHFDRNGGFAPFETPRELTEVEIDQITADFVQATENARAAGFDGVEIHGANGYLLDQFLQDNTNTRTDAYGGSIPNRARFLLEVVDAVCAGWSPDRVGVRLSPWGSFNDMRDSNPGPLYDHVGQELSKRRIAYAHVVEPRALQASDSNELDLAAPDAISRFRGAYDGNIVAAGGFTRESGEAAIAAGNATAIAYGRLFLANPDLPERFKMDQPVFNRHDRASFYGGGERGYIDYPTLAEALEPAAG
jgi:N-ethylmaleimide reductase